MPVHDRTRKAYRGVQGTSSSYSITFEADRIGSWVPVRFMHLEGLYELFVSKVVGSILKTVKLVAVESSFVREPLRAGGHNETRMLPYFLYV